ncbi:MAG: NADH-quinone oxidoreductase subunit J [Acidobacteria bacterium]|nr:NADH-quinone oxidoreductase subunit J [Acidobacteriota bacterium]
MTVFLFYVFAATALISALSVVLQKKTIYSALSLIVCLGMIAMLYTQLEATFIAVVQVIIYAGAIMVLFLFVLMLLDPMSEALPVPSKHIGYFAIPLGILLAILISLAGISYRAQPAGTVNEGSGDIAAVGLRLFSDYLLPFEATSILILVAVLGAVVLAKRKL